VEPINAAVKDALSSNEDALIVFYRVANVLLPALSEENTSSQHRTKVVQVLAKLSQSPAPHDSMLRHDVISSILPLLKLVNLARNHENRVEMFRDGYLNDFVAAE
jgi:hypothetical protein